MNRDIRRVAVLAATVLLAARSAQPQTRSKICSVSLQDHGSRAVGYSDLDKRMVKLLRDSGFAPVPVQFMPAADLEQKARESSCEYILYSDVMDLRRTAAAQIGQAVAGVGGAKKRETWEADVEFRLFRVGEVQSLMSATATGRNSKTPTQGQKSAMAEAAAAGQRGPDVLLDATPQELTGRQMKYRSVAVASAMEKGVKLVRNKIRGGPAEQ